MRNANRPSGPGKPEKEARDAAREQEEIEDASDAPSAEGQDDPTRGPRTAERDSHVNDDKKTAGSSGGRHAGRQSR